MEKLKEGVVFTKLSMKENHFMIQANINEQPERTAMFIPLSHILTNLFLNKFEMKI